MTVNKAMIIGRLGQDPEGRQTNSGTPVTNMSVATSREWDGGEETEWHRVTVFGKQAKACEKYLEKGRQVYVEGRLQTREWEDRDCNTRKTTEIVAHTVQFLSGGGQGGGKSRQSGGPEQGRQGGGGDYDQSFDNDEIPF